MRNRCRVSALFLASLVLTFAILVLAGCGSSTTVDSIAVSPSSVSVAAGATAQLTALGTVGHGSHPASSTNVTATATWSSSATSVATVSSTGVVTGVGAGTATITASMNGFGGLITSNSISVTVTGGGGGGTSSTLASLSIIPSAQSVSSPNQTSQFIAIGTTSSGATEDVTAQAVWSSSSTQIAKISSTGLATGLSQGTTTITAIVSNSGGTVVTATATFTVTGGASEPFTAIAISPGSQSLSATGQTGQFIALGKSGSTGLNQDITNSPQVTWSSSVPTVATISTYPAPTAGVATGASAGTTTITAKLTNPDGSVVTSSATVTVTITAAPEPLLSLTIVPSNVTVGNLQDTAQFLAFGTFSTTASIQDLTNSPSLTWTSSFPNDFPINTTGVPGAQAGLMTAYASGTAVVIAEAKNPDGSVVTATATFNCPLVLPTATSAGSCYPGSQAPSLLATLTVYGTGLDTTDWLVTANSATGTQDVIHCGPGASTNGYASSVCIGTYPVGTQVILTTKTLKFGGWSDNCNPITPDPSSAAGTNQCTVTLSTNDTVGAIFN
jgi:uncharacterized protein YjdB